VALASTVWDANLYLKFADARTRPALDLMGRLDPANAARPGHAIYDLGCGAGNISRILAERFPGAPVVGIDSSEQMLEKARGQTVDKRVTFTMGATPFLRDLTYVRTERDLSSLRVFISAGAPIPRQLVKDARERLRCAISAGWGMTENGLATCNGLTDPEEKVIGTDGLPLPGMALRVVDDAERDVPTGSEGDLLVKGPAQFVGYWKRPEFTREGHTSDGWFKTGDRATLDPDGYVSITGRSKDVIIRGGENIPVAEVENALFTHPKIAGVAVVAMPDPRLQERACAFVIPKDGETVTLADLVAHLDARQLAKMKFPERLEIVSEFPMTPSGKVQKYRLRQIVKEKIETEARQPR